MSPTLPRQRRHLIVGVVAVVVAAAAAATWWITRPSSGHGMTWGVVENLGAIGAQVVRLDCAAAAAKLVQPLDGGCNPEKGDTSCRDSLPLLCTLPPQPGSNIVEDGPLKGWAKTQLGATLRVRGLAIESAIMADQKCAVDLGVGWRAIQFFKGNPASFTGIRAASLEGAVAGTRYWVVAADQPGNCWDSAR